MIEYVIEIKTDPIIDGPTRWSALNEAVWNVREAAASIHFDEADYTSVVGRIVMTVRAAPGGLRITPGRANLSVRPKPV
jgi:hypothetical protein